MQPPVDGDEELMDARIHLIRRGMRIEIAYHAADACEQVGAAWSEPVDAAPSGLQLLRGHLVDGEQDLGSRPIVLDAAEDEDVDVLPVRGVVGLLVRVVSAPPL